MEPVKLEHINGALDDKNVIQEVEDAIGEIAQMLRDGAYVGDGTVTLKIKVKRVAGGDVCLAEPSVAVKLPTRMRSATTLFPGDDGVTRAESMEQLDIHQMTKGGVK